MNKTKLEVIRINEDVIATSSAKSLYEGTVHLKVTNYESNENGRYVYDYYGNDGAYISFSRENYGSELFNLFASGSIGDWYYEVTPYSDTFAKCDDPDHSYYHKP